MNLIVIRHFTRVGYALHTISMLPTTNCGLQLPGLRKRPKAAVVSFLDIIRKTAAGQFFHSEVISQAVATHAFFATRISAITILQILLFFTFHLDYLHLILQPFLLKMQFDNIPVSQLIGPVHILPIVDILAPRPCTF